MAKKKPEPGKVTDLRFGGLKFQVKKLYEDSKLPTRAYQYDAGWDFYARVHKEGSVVYQGEVAKIPLGVASALPPGYCWQVWDRSGVASKKKLGKLAGLIDCGYRDEMTLVVVNFGTEPQMIEPGQKVCQMVIVPCPEFSLEEVQELPPSDRGERGFGSSDK